MHVVATAGHVDHGKSTLVRALTGTDPDRLAEERRRGLTIELGYAWTTLDDVGEVAFVDVPGHERFVTTMLAGVGPVPVALLVVAADDPWMPQSAEHLAALDALGVAHGLLVVTRSDLADPGPALGRARAEVDRTSLAGCRAVCVSARTGEGMAGLRAALVEVLGEVPRPDPAADVRLWVDRSFTLAGAGRVVTGTLPAGTLAVGDRLVAGDHDGSRGSATLTVRGLEALGRERSSVTGPARVAVRLGGGVELARGTPLCVPGAFVWTTVADVRVEQASALPERPVLHVGSARTGVRVRPLGDAAVRVRLPEPVPLRVGDRVLLRDPGDRRVVGASVLDPAPPPLPRRRGAAVRRGRDLADLDGSVTADLRLRGLARQEDLRRLGVRGAPTDAVAAGGWLLSPDRAARERDALLAQVRGDGPDGVPVAVAARRLGLPHPALVEALVDPPLRLVRGRVRADAAQPASEGEPEVPPAVHALREQLLHDPFAAPDANGLAALGLDDGALVRLQRAGHVLRLAPGLVLLPTAAAEAERRLRDLPAPFTTSQARQALGTSRRVALPLLAHLDRSGVTVRLADDRRRLRRRG